MKDRIDLSPHVFIALGAFGFHGVGNICENVNSIEDAVDEVMSGMHDQRTWRMFRLDFDVITGDFTGAREISDDAREIIRHRLDAAAEEDGLPLEPVIGGEDWD